MENKSPETRLKFPCKFAIKVMGKAASNIENTAAAIVKEHCPDFSGKYDKRESRDGNYLALTFTIHAESKEQLDKIYIALSECQDVIMSL